MAEPPSDDPIATSLRKTLNSHGYGFQYRVLKECSDRLVQCGGASARTRLIADEVPVTVNQQELHVDGILELVSAEFNARNATQVFIVVECKRTDPRVSRWGFAVADERRRPLIIDTFRERKFSPIEVIEDDTPRIQATARAHARPTVQVGVELKVNATGDGTGKSLDLAITQAFRGAAGLANALLRKWIDDRTIAIIVPMIVTSAGLFEINTRLSDAALATGELPAGDVKGVPFVWYSGNINRSLMPNVMRSNQSSSPANTIAHRHSRSVLIVNEAGLDQGLASLLAVVSSLNELP
jgi:hypothetical protein